MTSTRVVQVSMVFMAILVSGGQAFGQPGTEAGGALQILDSEGAWRGACPLKFTDVEADVVGFFAFLGLAAWLIL